MLNDSGELGSAKGADPTSQKGAGAVTLSVVVPVFDEDSVVRSTASRLTEVMDAIGESYEILFVDDGSTDATRPIIEDLCQADPHVGLVAFSRNFGHQVAITAGIERARGEGIIIIDGDLQDPPELIPDLVAAWRQGFDVVNTHRVERLGESFFKRWSAAIFYRLLRKMTDFPIPLDTGDFRLIDRRVRDVLAALPEHHRFVRGLVAWAGFRQTSLPYVRQARQTGRTKYTLPKMLNLASDAVTSFSYRPLRAVSYTGGLFTVLGLGFLIIAAIARLRTDLFVPLLAAMGAFTGFVLIAVGLVGVYLARVLDDVRGRPMYILAEHCPPAIHREDPS